MIFKLMFKVSYSLVNKNLFRYYNELMKNSTKSLEQLEQEENLALQKLIKHAFRNIPYYIELSQKLGLTADDISCKNDLIKLPVLTKSMIKSRPQDFIYDYEKNYKVGKTGGSTGTPLQFRMSRECFYKGTAMRMVMFNKAGYEPGDLIINFGGGSLVGKPSLKSKLTNFVLNTKSFSSYGFSEETVKSLFSEIENQNKVCIYGYASSIYLLSKYILDHSLNVRAKGGLFATSEQLFASQRKVINRAFPNCDLFDIYGLNDGGITACECTEHNGMHVDFGRGLLEVVDENGNHIIDKPGKIIATSLYNYSFPFIRYDTDDIGTLTYATCNCGLDTPRLLNLEGRKTDYLEYAGRKIGSPVLTVLMSTVPEVDVYRVIQKESGDVIFKLCMGRAYSNDDHLRVRVENKIKESFLDKLPGVKLSFEHYESPRELMTNENKYRIIINEKIRS